jgi:hypothetical protein
VLLWNILEKLATQDIILVHRVCDDKIGLGTAFDTNTSSKEQTLIRVLTRQEEKKNKRKRCKGCSMNVVVSLGALCLVT